jgi:hypothetical protein
MTWATYASSYYKGIESIRVVEQYAAPLLIVMCVALFCWAYAAAGGMGAMLSAPSAFVVGGAQEAGYDTRPLSSLCHYNPCRFNLCRFTYAVFVTLNLRPRTRQGHPRTALCISDQPVGRFWRFPRSVSLAAYPSKNA